jgi:type IV secretion system protein VirB1
VIVWHDSWRNAMSMDVHVTVLRIADYADRIRECRAAIRAVDSPAADHFRTRYTTSSSKSRALAHNTSAAAVIAAFCASPIATSAAPLSQTSFARLASQCAPTVPAAMLDAVARTESGLDPWALHDNTTGTGERPASQEQAISDAQRWIDRGDSVDIGLMQINSTNLPALSMTISSALDSCASLTGGAAVLRAAYGGGATSAEKQTALLIALSRYNTGSAFAGIMNGYARTVMANAGGGTETAPSSGVNVPILSDPNAPPSWNVSATGSYAQHHGASWLIQLAPTQDSRRPRAGPSVRTRPQDVIASK